MVTAPPQARRRPTQPPRGTDTADEDGLPYTGPLTAAHVESEIMRLSQNMDEVTEELRNHAQAMAVAEHGYKLAYARAMMTARATLDGDGPKGRVTVDQAECFAIDQCEAELLEHLKTQVVYEVDRSLLQTLRSQVDALRTIAANIRHQT